MLTNPAAVRTRITYTSTGITFLTNAGLELRHFSNVDIS